MIIAVPLITLALTIIIEFIVYLIAIRKNICNLFLSAVLINSFTNPLANIIANNNLMNLIAVELGVFIVEIFLIKYMLQIKYWKAIAISFIANFVTIFIMFFT